MNATDLCTSKHRDISCSKSKKKKLAIDFLSFFLNERLWEEKKALLLYADYWPIAFGKRLSQHVLMNHRLQMKHH